LAIIFASAWIEKNIETSDVCSSRSKISSGDRDKGMQSLNAQSFKAKFLRVNEKISFKKYENDIEMINKRYLDIYSTNPV
jgi:hypothetical protein